MVAATVLTGKTYSAKLAPEDSLIQALREKHGQDFEDWWRERLGFGYDSLTRSEARYLGNSPDAHTIRDRLIAAGLEGGPVAAHAAAGPLVKPEPGRHSGSIAKKVPAPKAPK